MRRRSLALLVGVITMLAGAFVVSTKAQIPEHEILKARVPFKFMINDRTFPAGEYEIRQAPDGADQDAILELVALGQNIKPELFETLPATAETVPGHSHLIFDKIDGKYFLSRVFMADSNQGAEVPETKMERKLEKQNMKAEKFELKVDHWRNMEKG